MLSSMQQDMADIKAELAEHTRILDEHTQLLNKHTRLLNKHGRDIASLKESVDNINIGVGMLCDWAEEVGDMVRIPFAQPKTPSA